MTDKEKKIQEEIDFFKKLFDDCEIITSTNIDDDLREILEKKDFLNIKFGIDPTATELHLGWLVPLLRLRELQERGHCVELVIGSTTAKIGDPTGKSTTRKMLSTEKVEDNLQKLLPNFKKVLKMSQTKLRNNAVWWSSITAETFVSMCSNTTVARILERDDFTKRLKNNQQIGLHEILYPILQAQDSVKIQCDIELGGSDQKFNCLLGRDMMSKAHLAPQIVVLTPLLIGTDGINKMSQSLKNTISIDCSPEDMFGKVMSISDELIENWWTALKLKGQHILLDLKDPSINPKSVKQGLAVRIVELIHGGEKAKEAFDHFCKTFEQKDWKSTAPTMNLTFDTPTKSLSNCIVELGFTQSNNEAKNIIKHGGVTIGDKKILDHKLHVTKEELQNQFLKVGKTRFAKINIV